MSANIFQTLFDVSIPDKVNGIADNDNLIGGVDPKVENANGTKAAPNEPAVAVEPAPAPALNGPTTNVPAAAKEFSPNAKPANEPAVGVPVLPANENVPVPTNAKSVSSPEPELKIVPICETNQILKRAVIIIFIFCLATYLAAITLAVRPILEFVLGPDINLSINNDNYTKKWFSIAKLILIYIAFIIAYVIGIILVITCIVMICMIFTGTDTVIDDTMITMLFYLWQFEEKSSIWYIYAVLIAVIFIAVILFLYYHLYIKS
jgi:hypothetical protein